MIYLLDMDTNVIKSVLLITAAHLILSAGCNKNGTTPCRNDAYSFAVTSYWEPQKNSYTVGDTIYLYSSFPKSLTNLINNTLVDYSNAVAIGGGIGMGYLDTISRNAMPARNKFDFFAITGTIGESIVAPDQGPAFTYAENSTIYSFRCGIVCKQKGIFMFNVSDLKSPGLMGKNCTNAGFGMTVTNSDKHFSLYQYALGIAPESGTIQNGYCFRVE